MENTFALIQKKRYKWLINTFETIKGFSFFIGSGLIYQGFRSYSRSVNSKTNDENTLAIILLSLGCFIFLFSVYDIIRRNFFKHKRNNHVIGSIYLGDDFLKIKMNESTEKIFHYNEVERIDIYYYSGIEASGDKKHNVFSTIKIMHIRLYAEDIITHLYVENNTLDKFDLGALYNRLEALRISNTAMYKTIQYWADFKDE